MSVFDAIPAKDLLAIIEAFVAAHGGDAQIVSIEWTLRTYSHDYDVRIETLESYPPRPKSKPPQEQPTP